MLVLAVLLLSMHTYGVTGADGCRSSLPAVAYVSASTENDLRHCAAYNDVVVIARHDNDLSLTFSKLIHVRGSLTIFAENTASLTAKFPKLVTVDGDITITTTSPTARVDKIEAKKLSSVGGSVFIGDVTSDAWSAAFLGRVNEITLGGSSVSLRISGAVSVSANTDSARISDVHLEVVGIALLSSAPSAD